MSRNSHIPHDKCLNCGAELQGRYCHVCGQDSGEHMDSVGHLVKHFFEDITHYDSKLWKTVKPLLTKPGFLTQEFLKGKRASYLNPVRMFIFLNFIFFFLVISLPNRHSFENEKISAEDSLDLKSAKSFVHLDTNKKIVRVNQFVAIQETSEYASGTAYDSAQKMLPPGKRDGRITATVNKKIFDLLRDIKRDRESVSEKLDEIFYHNAAKLTFLFLIACTLLLSLFYYRHHIKMTDHALLAIHLTCTFLLLGMITLLLSYLPYGEFFGYFIFLYGAYYFYRALRVVYGRSRGKTLLKFFTISILLFTVMFIGIAITALFSVWSL